MSQAYPPPPSKPSSDLNTVGLIGLIVAILGLLTFLIAPVGLLLSLVGLILSFVGLRHPQKGLAIGSLVVSVFGTLVNGVLSFIFFMYFGMVGTFCCFAMNAVQEQEAQETAAKQAVTPLLGKTVDEIEIEGFFAPSFEASPQGSGQAVYTDDAGVKKEVDFSVTLEKIDGQWQATNATLDSEPRDWMEFDFDEDEEFDDGNFDEETTPEESPTGEEDATDAPVEGAEDQDPLDAVFDEGEAG